MVWEGSERMFGWVVGGAWARWRSGLSDSRTGFLSRRHCAVGVLRSL